jgi:hypothetical protein
LGANATAIEAWNAAAARMSVSAQLASGSLSKLQLALNLVFAAIAGWEIGKWMTDNWKTAADAGVWAGAILSKVLARITAYAEIAMVAIGNMFEPSKIGPAVSAIKKKLEEEITAIDEYVVVLMKANEKKFSPKVDLSDAEKIKQQIAAISVELSKATTEWKKKAGEISLSTYTGESKIREDAAKRVREVIEPQEKELAGYKRLGKDTVELEKTIGAARKASAAIMSAELHNLHQEWNQKMMEQAAAHTVKLVGLEGERQAILDRISGNRAVVFGGDTPLLKSLQTEVDAVRATNQKLENLVAQREGIWVKLREAMATGNVPAIDQGRKDLDDNLRQQANTRLGIADAEEKRRLENLRANQATGKQIGLMAEESNKAILASRLEENEKRIEIQRQSGYLTQIEADRDLYEIRFQYQDSELARLLRKRAVLAALETSNENILEVEKVSNDIAATRAKLTSLEGDQERIRLLERQRGALYGVRVGLLEVATAATDWGSQMKNVVTKSFQSMEDALIRFVNTGKLSFKELANSIIQDMIRIAMQQSVTGPLAKMLGGLTSGGGGLTQAQFETMWVAQGAAFTGGDVIPFRRGGVVGQPTMFRFAKGTGMMGEAGPEAIMPLSRTPSGDLGVKSASQGPTSIRVEIKNESGKPVAAKSSTASMNLQEMVISIVLDGIDRNVMGLGSALGR